MEKKIWNDVTESLPQDNREVLIYTFDGKYVIGKINKVFENYPWTIYGYNSLFCSNYRLNDVKAWAELPEYEGIKYEDRYFNNMD